MTIKYKGNSGHPQEHHYRVMPNSPYPSFSIHELWPGGRVRSPFRSRREAIIREEEIAAELGYLDTLILDKEEDDVF